MEILTTKKVLEQNKGLLTSPIAHLSRYLDYRKFLRDFYEYKKELSKVSHLQYTFAVFSAAADIKSPNYLKLIIDGKRNLSGEMIFKFAKALGLTKEQTEEFKLLVLYTQAAQPPERNQHLKELFDYRLKWQIKEGFLDSKTLEKFPSWVGWILYSMIDQEGVVFDGSSLKTLLRGTASELEIKEAFLQLKKSGAISVDERGEVKKTGSLFEAGEELPTALIRNLQAHLMYLGLESLFKDDATEREFGTLTLALNKDEFEDLRFQLRKLRKNINKENGLKRASTKGERVYQLNLQLFPVTDQFLGNKKY